MKNCLKKIVAFALSMLMLVPVAACNKNSASTVVAWWWGSEAELGAYKEMAEEFNNTVGKEEGFKVNPIVKPFASYQTLIQTKTVGSKGPDVFFVWDRWYHKWANDGILTNITDYVDASVAAGDLDLTDIWDVNINMQRYNTSNNTSGGNNPLYALPLNTATTALYYNADALKTVGVKIISVDEADLDAWNRNEIADKTGKKKSDYGIAIDVPAKGFYRDNPYMTTYYSTGEEGPLEVQSAWSLPTQGEVMVFNNRIPMSWDELEDLAMLTTKEYNTAATTTYGVYINYWFNYGWTVGGDCVQDLSGNGDWSFSIADITENFIVADGKEYTGEFTGKTYSAGETLEFLDKLNYSAGQTIKAEDDGTYTIDGNDVVTRPGVTAAVQNGTLISLPSTRSGFERWANMKLKGSDGQGGFEGGSHVISPSVALLPSSGTEGYFYMGDVALLLEQSLSMANIGTYADFEWDVAPLPMYKEYASTNPLDASVARRGKQAGHVTSSTLAISQSSTKKDRAYKFVAWMAGPKGQTILAKHGFVPNQRSIASSDVYKSNTRANSAVFTEACEYETPGDWWYMPDREWIDTWSSPLNSSSGVQGNRMTLEEFFDQTIPAVNLLLQNYKVTKS